MGKKNGFRDVSLDFDLKEAMSSVKINKEAGVIQDVVLLTGEKVTKNKTRYTIEALKEARVRYEGAKMFLDHGEEMVRSVRDYGGVYRRVRLNENKVVADLHVREGSDVRNLVFSMAEHLTGGLSIRDRGRGREEGDVFIVEGFAKGGPFSIDLVTEPSANQNLFESVEDEEEENKGGNDMLELAKVTLEQLMEANPKLVESIRADERGKANSEFEAKLKESKESAEKALAQSKKMTLLAEAGFAPKVQEAVRKMIEAEGITVEVAEGIIKSQKEVIESIGTKPAGNPKVNGHGADRETVESEEDEEEIKKEFSDENLTEALMSN